MNLDIKKIDVELSIEEITQSIATSPVIITDKDPFENVRKVYDDTIQVLFDFLRDDDSVCRRLKAVANALKKDIQNFDKGVK